MLYEVITYQQNSLKNLFYFESVITSYSIHYTKLYDLSGWVDTKRDLGGLTFIDMRDREGKTQVVFNPEEVNVELMEKAQKLKSEYVIKISGEVRERYSKNLNIPTGEIEVFADGLEVLNSCGA